MRELDNDCKKQLKRYEQINLDMSNLLFIFSLPTNLLQYEFHHIVIKFYHKISLVL